MSQADEDEDDDLISDSPPRSREKNSGAGVSGAGKKNGAGAGTKKRGHGVSSSSPSSTSKKYKKKKYVEPIPRPDGSIDADDVIDLPRLNEMFNRYMICYEEATREKTNRFGGLTEFVFAILLELGAEVSGGFFFETHLFIFF